MDNLDHALISKLRLNARSSVADLAKALKVSRGTVSNRLSRLESEGIIVGYTLKLRPDATPNEIVAWTSIAVEGSQQSVLHALLGEPGIAVLHDTNGRWDLLAELRVDNLADLASALERIRKIKGISATETSIHLQSYRG